MRRSDGADTAGSTPEDDWIPLQTPPQSESARDALDPFGEIVGGAGTRAFENPHPSKGTEIFRSGRKMKVIIPYMRAQDENHPVLSVPSRAKDSIVKVKEYPGFPMLTGSF